MNRYTGQQKAHAADIVRAAREAQLDRLRQQEREHVRANAHLRGEYLQQRVEREQDRKDATVMPVLPEPGSEPDRPPAGLDPGDPWTYDPKRAFRAKHGIWYE